MKRVAQFLYMCFYNLILAKNFRHDRAAFAFSISISLYLLAIVIFVTLYFEIYNYVSPLFFSALLFVGGTASSYLFDKGLNRREFYSEAKNAFDSNSHSTKIIFGLFGGILFVLSWVSVIYSFLVFAHKV